MIQVTDTVRVVHSTGLVRTAFFATVLSVQPPHVDDDGTNGEPTITIGFIDKDLKHMLGSGRWELAYKRIPTVRHVSHDEVQDLATEYCYTEVLPSDGGPIHLQKLIMDDPDAPPAYAAKAADTVGTIVYINHFNGLEVKHEEENIYGVSINDIHTQFSDLFSAKVYVDAQPKPEIDPGLASIPQSVGNKSMHEIAEEARQKEEKDGEASLSTPEEITQDAIDLQNEHDRSTGNVDDQGRTPAEVVESETQL